MLFNKKHESYDNCLKESDGLLVMASFFKLQEEENRELAVLIDSVAKVLNYGQETKLGGGLDLLALLSKNLKVFYRYSGSLTSAPCNEVVNWIVFPNPVAIGFRQFAVFQKLMANNQYSGYMDSSTGKSNSRLLQQINDRFVESSV